MMVPNGGAVGGSGNLTINSTPIAGATGAILWDDTGILQEVTIGANLTFAGGVLSATTGAGIVINTTAISGGTSGRVLYDNAATVGEAANFTIIAGNPNVALGQAYLYNGVRAIFEVPNVIGDNWFEGESGNAAVTGGANFGTGSGALTNLTSGNSNMAVGVSALGACTTGSNNVGIGTSALGHQTTDSANIGLGFGAGININLGGSFNTCVGYAAGQGITTGGSNTAIGSQATPNNIGSGYQNIVIGQACDVATPNGSSQISIGNMIYGTNCFGTGNTISPGWIGVGVKAAYGSEIFSAAGTIMTNSATNMIGSNTAYNNGAGALAATFTNSPVAGNPTKWIPINDAGVTRYIPAF